jgi:mRNA-degrading endonuclease RelE of RelBE toxin-antitoxin system
MLPLKNSKAASKYQVIVHRRVQKFIVNLKDPNAKATIVRQIDALQNYPLSLREMDTEKVKGSADTFRIRVGKHRIIFLAAKAERTIYVVHIEARKNVYEKIG